MYDAVAEDRIDPQHVQQWQTSLAVHEPDAPEQESIDARLTGTDGRNRRYAVVAVRDGDDTRWLDPAGFELAVSKAQTPSGSRLFRSDFELRTAGNRAGVEIGRASCRERVCQYV